MEDVDEVQPLVSVPPPDMRSELAGHVLWSAMAPHGRRGSVDNVDAALRRSRRDVLRTVAALRASDEELRGAKPPRAPQTASLERHIGRCGSRKALYPRHTTALFKTMDDLVDHHPSSPPAPTQMGGAVRCQTSPSSTTEAAAAGDTCVVWRDPRGAVADKHRAAVEVVRPQIPPGIARSLHDHTRHLGAVKPYGLSRRARRGGERFVAPPVVGIHEHFVDRMQCCRPSKGLYVYYDS